MDKFVLNLIHRPEMVPEYSATVTGQGKEEIRHCLPNLLIFSRHSRDLRMRMA